MNNLPFDSKPLQYYGNTFLQRVIVEIGFDSLKEENAPSSFKEELCRFLDSHFGISFEEGMVNAFWKDGVQLSKGDKSIIWQLKSDRVSAMIGTNDYKSFVDSVLPTVFKMRSFIRNVLGLNEVVKLQVRKINAWQFHDVKSDSLRKDVLEKAILSAPLLNFQSKAELSTSERAIPGFKKVSFVEGDDSLFIRHFCKKLNDGVMVLFLDTERLYCNVLEEKDIENHLVKMNKDLYDAFHWCVTSKVLEIMKGGK